jgi:hypothetical protein
MFPKFLGYGVDKPDFSRYVAQRECELCRGSLSSLSFRLQPDVTRARPDSGF